MINFRMLKFSDYTLWIAIAILIAISCLLILSATASMQSRIGGDAFLFLKRHFFSLIIALVGLSLFLYFDYAHLKNAAVIIYIFTVLFLIITFFFGLIGGGAQRWLTLGPISLQPSELAKLTVIICLAAYLEKRRTELKSLVSLIPAFVLVGIPFIFIFKQPDLGTSLVLLAICFGMLAFSGIKPLLLFYLFSPVLGIIFHSNIFLFLFYLLALGWLLYTFKSSIIDGALVIVSNISMGYFIPHVWGMLKEYQRLRILTFLNPELDPKGAGYHALQAKIAVGNGGFFGEGLFRGTQTQLQFIPKQFTDFIFSVAGEELGFIGSVFIIAVYVVVIWRAITIAMESRDSFGSLLAGGIAVMVSFHFIVNIGMTLGLVPVVGIPLPFLSFGGTSLFANFIALGILQNIYMRRQKLLF